MGYNSSVDKADRRNWTHGTMIHPELIGREALSTPLVLAQLTGQKINLLLKPVPLRSILEVKVIQS